MRIDRKPSNQINKKVIYGPLAFAVAGLVVDMFPQWSSAHAELAIIFEFLAGVIAAWLIPDVKLGK